MAYVGKQPQPKFLGQVDDLTVAGDANITGAVDIDTSLNVDGTVTADGLTVEADSAPTITIKSTDTSLADNQVIGRLDFFKSDVSGSGSADVTSSIVVRSADGIGASSDLTISTDAGSGETTRALFGANGDISFYEDTGTTAKFFWDASAERLGINTAAPTQTLNVLVPDNDGVQIESGAGHKGYLFFGDDSSNTVGRIGYDHATNHMDFWTNSTEAMRIDSSGNVGIGRSPSFKLDMNTSTGIAIRAVETTTGNTGRFQAGVDSGLAFIEAEAGGGSIALGFKVSDSEKMRIDSSGNVLVGTTNTDPAGNNVAGIALRSNGAALISRDGARAADFNRTDDGDIVAFKKAGSTVGTITAWAGDIRIGTGDTAFRFHDGSDEIRPAGSTGADRDNAIDLGSSSARFKDLYLSGTARLSGNNPKTILKNAASSTNSRSSYIQWTQSDDGQSAYVGYGSSSNDSFGIVQTLNDEIFFATNNNRKVTIDEAGNVLIGTTNLPASLISATSGGGIALDPDSYSAFNRQATSSGQANIIFNQTGVDSEFLQFRKDGSKVGAIANRGTLVRIGKDDVGLEFHAGDNAIYPANISAGTLPNNTITLGGNGYAFKDLYLAGGVYLGGTGAANYLDDYEEGTWTPTITYADGSATSTQQNGYYIKVGDLVHLWGLINVSNTNSNTGTAYISNFPFNVSDVIASTGLDGYGGFYYWGASSTAMTNLSIGALGADTKGSIYYAGSNGGTELSNATATTLGTFNGRFWVTYKN